MDKLYYITRIFSFSFWMKKMRNCGESCLMNIFFCLGSDSMDFGKDLALCACVLLISVIKDDQKGWGNKLVLVDLFY